MEMMRIIGIALCGMVITVVLRAFDRREAALLCEIACGIVLLTLIFSQAGGALEGLNLLREKATLDDELMQLLIKVTGIAVLAELAAQLCRDTGVGALAQKIELGGKVVILCATLPTLLDMCDVALSLLG